MDSADKYERFLLVVDGNIDDRFRTGELLRQLGYAMLAAGGAEQALEMMTATPPAAVLAAGADGMSLLAAMKKSPALASVPIILLVEAPNAVLEGRAQRGVIAGLLRKPLDAERLFHLIERTVVKGSRRHMRAAVSLPVQVAGDGGVTEGAATVLSESGMFIRTLDPHPTHTRVTIALELDRRQVALEGEVVFACGLEDGPFREPGMGIKFVTIAPEVRSAVAAYVREGLKATAENTV